MDRPEKDDKKRQLDIPGWKLGRGAGEQLVVGAWYIPSIGCHSLKEVVGEWIEAVREIYYQDTVLKNGKRISITGVGDEAIKILISIGHLDENGNENS